MEEAEDRSRREQTEEARGLFLEGAKMFVEAYETIEAKIGEIETKEEKKVASELAKASAKRREYCFGRSVIEEAKLLDRRGDHLTSSKKYGLAADTFSKIVETEPERSRRELLPIIYLSQAWQEMIARARVSLVELVRQGC